MKVETMATFGAAFGSAGLAVQRRPQSEAQNSDAADLRRGRPVSASEPAAQDFALAMRRVEAECYDTL